LSFIGKKSEEIKAEIDAVSVKIMSLKVVTNEKGEAVGEVLTIIC
jgi:transcriptional regulator of met regulon